MKNRHTEKRLNLKPFDPYNSDEFNNKRKDLEILQSQKQVLNERNEFLKAIKK